MTVLRVGTRGSELALRQTRWVCAQMAAAHAGKDSTTPPQRSDRQRAEANARPPVAGKPLRAEASRGGPLTIQEVVIKTHGDLSTGQLFDKDWPAGGFVGAIEEALLRGEIDFAVHSYKDLPTDATPGLTIAAVPQREAAHDVLITRQPVDLGAMPPGLRIGTSSPRRAAQIRRWAKIHGGAGATVLPIRGNVPTRIAKVDGGEFDGVILAAAGLARLGLRPANCIDLPWDEFVPAPAQGALAVQVREGDEAAKIVATIDDPAVRLATDAERAFLSATGAGCHVPVGAYATLAADGAIDLSAQLFTEDGSRVAQGRETGRDPAQVGASLASRLRAELA